jgi:hypothetical protein
MRFFAVFEPAGRGSETARAERFLFVRDGFSWGAFLFGPLWMVWRGLWLVLIGYVLLIVALEATFRAVGLSGVARGGILLLIALLLGLEGASLQRWTLIRRGWRDLGVVAGVDEEAAERRFFESWANAGRGAEGRREPPANPAAAPRAAPAAQSSGIVGLFPEPGR